MLERGLARRCARVVQSRRRYRGRVVGVVM
jgi:hypothetical protein